MTANHLDTVKEETLFYGTRSSPSSAFSHHRSWKPREEKGERERERERESDSIEKNWSEMNLFSWIYIFLTRPWKDFLSSSHRLCASEYSSLATFFLARKESTLAINGSSGEWGIRWKSKEDSLIKEVVNQSLQSWVNLDIMPRILYSQTLHGAYRLIRWKGEARADFLS